MIDPDMEGGFTIQDEKHNSIPRTPKERTEDRKTNEWIRKAERARRDKGRKR